MTETIRANSAADFLALVPQMLGFTPEESLVLIPFAGSRSLGAMRVDLPTQERDEGLVASTAVGLVGRVPGIEGVAAVVYTAAPAPGDSGLLALMEEYLTLAGLRTVDLLYVCGDGWGSLHDESAPHSLGLVAWPAIARKVKDGNVLPEVSDAFRRQVLEYPSQLWGLENLIEFNEEVLNLTPAGVTPGHLALLAEIIERPSLRDVLIAQAVDDEDTGARALEAQLDWQAGEKYPEDLASRMWGEGARPNPQRLDNLLAITRILLAVKPSGHAFSLAAWLCWSLGRSSRAEDFARQGLALDTEHGLCKIVDAFVQAGYLPGWAFSPKTNA